MWSPVDILQDFGSRCFFWSSFCFSSLNCCAINVCVRLSITMVHVFDAPLLLHAGRVVWFHVDNGARNGVMIVAFKANVDKVHMINAQILVICSVLHWSIFWFVRRRSCGDQGQCRQDPVHQCSCCDRQVALLGSFPLPVHGALIIGVTTTRPSRLGPRRHLIQDTPRMAWSMLNSLIDFLPKLLPCLAFMVSFPLMLVMLSTVL